MLHIRMTNLILRADVRTRIGGIERERDEDVATRRFAAGQCPNSRVGSASEIERLRRQIARVHTFINQKAKGDAK